MTARTLQVDDPFTGQQACELPFDDQAAALAALERCAAAQGPWAETAVEVRAALVVHFAEAFLAEEAAVAEEITRTMGKPLAQARAEVRTLADRARTLAALAPEALAEVELPAKAGFDRRVAREPLGVVLVVAPWNYPLLTAVNAVAAAVLAGDGVLLKHSSRTPLCGPQFERAFRQAGAPEGLVRSLTLSHEDCDALMHRPEVGYVAFTGSVEGGRQIQAQLAERFAGVSLELGGKDGAYVAEDADLPHAIEQLADGAFYNAGQSCCGVKRIFVHEACYDRFADGLVAAAQAYRLGDPRDPATTLGPLATPGTPAALAGQAERAVAAGARLLCGGRPEQIGGRGRFLPPTVVADAASALEVMQEESFGPLVALAKVRDDEEAMRRLGDCRFGLTASVWTRDPERARRLGRRLAVGTIFMNRCDYLDPMLPWVGVKDSGRGLSLSRWGIQELTRPKSYHFRLAR
ncbi:MAG: aldehyde dehydrogenase family protein [Myxococcales bacterium]